MKLLALPVLVVSFAAGHALAAAVTPAPTFTASAAVGGEKVNINTASVKELMTLAGVGRKVAEKIVEYRQAHGPFRKAADVKKVDGVGEGLLEQNRGRIVVK